MVVKSTQKVRTLVGPCNPGRFTVYILYRRSTMKGLGDRSPGSKELVGEMLALWTFFHVYTRRLPTSEKYSPSLHGFCSFVVKSRWPHEVGAVAATLSVTVQPHILKMLQSISALVERGGGKQPLGCSEMTVVSDPLYVNRSTFTAP